MCSNNYLLRLLLVALLFACLAACQGETKEDHHKRAERLNKECRRSVGEDYVYRTAAGFKLTVPKWASGDLQPFQYGPDCKLNNIRLVFAWVDRKLIPVRQGGLHQPPAALALPERDHHDYLIVMMGFQPPRTMSGPENWEYCKDNPPQFDYPKFKLRMCPYAQKQPHLQRPIFALPYRPRFEVIGEKYPAYSMTCADEVFSNVTAANVVDATVEYSCRGYWYWRPGAAGMFDLDSRAALKEFHLVLPAAERYLNEWIVQGDEESL